MKDKYKPLSDYLNVDSKLFKTKGVLNPTINTDTRLFIDPMLLRKSSEIEFNNEAASLYVKFFQDIYDKIIFIVENDLEDKIKERIYNSLINHIMSKEKIGLCLGYSKSNNRGRGIGYEHAKALIDNAIDIIKLGAKNPIIFHSLFLLEEGIGPDFISDMTARIIEKSLYAYTQRIAKELGIMTQSYTIKGERYLLPKHPKENTFLILVPMDILSQIPVESNFDEIMGGFINDNDSIRQRINHDIAEILYDSSKEKTSDIKKKVKEYIIDKNLIIDLAEFISNSNIGSYDIGYDPLSINTVLLFKDFAESQKDEMDLSINKKQANQEIIEEIINKFKNYVSTNNNLKRNLLWHNGEPKKEKCWQEIFNCYISLILEHHNLDLTPEFETGIGPVDFKISQGSDLRVIVEMKLSNNKYKDGLKKQLEAYKQAASIVEKAYYIYIDLETNQKTAIRKIKELNQIKAECQLNTDIIIIDGKIGPSASNL